MRKPAAPRIVSANDLMTGAVVYLTAAGDFSPDIGEAAVADDPQTADALLGRALAQPHRAVGAYLVDVDPSGAAPRPLHRREAIREAGPTHIPAFDRRKKDGHVPL